MRRRMNKYYIIDNNGQNSQLHPDVLEVQWRVFTTTVIYILRFSVTSVNNSLRFGRQGQVSIPRGRCAQHRHQGSRHPEAFQN